MVRRKLNLILKLIENNTTPKMGDLVKSRRGWIGIFGEHENSYEDECTVLKPYGISYEERPLKGDVIWDVDTNIISVCTYLQQSVSSKGNIDLNWYKKVVILPEQFNYQEIVDLGLKDGDELNVYSVDNVIGTLPNNQVMLLEPTHTYTDEEVLDTILNEFGNELMNKLAWREIQNSSNGIAQFVTEFLNKKK
jgi:hypothetical protein